MSAICIRFWEPYDHDMDFLWTRKLVACRRGNSLNSGQNRICQVYFACIMAGLICFYHVPVIALGLASFFIAHFWNNTGSHLYLKKQLLLVLIIILIVDILVTFKLGISVINSTISVSELVKFRSSTQSSSFGKKCSRPSSITVELTKNQLQLRTSGFSSGFTHLEFLCCSYVKTRCCGLKYLGILSRFVSISIERLQWPA